MSVEVLKLIDEDMTITIKEEGDNICFYFRDCEIWSGFRLDRKQAHLLYLYLKERFEPK